MSHSASTATEPVSTGSERPLVLLSVEIRGHSRMPLDDRLSASHLQGALGLLLEGLERELPGLEVVHRESSRLLLAGSDLGRDTLTRITRLPLGILGRMARLEALNTCTCAACERLGRLRVRVVVHVGPLVAQRHGRDWEISGLEATRHHRLCRMELEGAACLLLSEPAAQLLPNEVLVAMESLESVDLELEGFGTTGVRLCSWDRPERQRRAGLPGRLVMALRKVLWAFRFR